MSTKNLIVKYLCQHPSCQVFCMKGELALEETGFEELKEAYDDSMLFKSPRGVCKMGYNQPFKIVSVRDEASSEQAPSDNKINAADDPIEILKAEHKVVLARLEDLEEQLRQRDIDGLWLATTALENEITLHSVKKEEEALFPILANKKKDSMVHAFMQIVHEDHKEFVSLLHSFRCALQENQILDGIVNSLITNLKNHILKEDDEFFTMVNECLSAEDRSLLLGRMKTIESNFVPEKPGDRSDKKASPFLENRKLLDAEITQVRAENCTDDWSCH